MTGLRDTIRGECSQRDKAPLAKAQEEQPSSRKISPSEGGLVVVEGRSGWLFWETELGKKG